MKIRIEIDDDMEEEELIVRCKTIDERINYLYNRLRELTTAEPKFTFYKKNQSFYFPLSDVLFFETENDYVYAHTKDEMYRVTLRLYELENTLPKEFVRSSKSTILNVIHVFSVNRNVTSSSLIKFHNSYKQVYVSRFYYKGLKQKLDERSN